MSLVEKRLAALGYTVPSARALAAALLCALNAATELELTVALERDE
jgi:hypothetical protein